MSTLLYRRSLDVAVAGMLVGDPGKVRSGINASRKYSATITVDTAADSTVYTATIKGIAVSITSGTGATVTTIRDQLVAEVAVNKYSSREHVTANGAGPDELSVTTRYRNIESEVTVGANLSVVVDSTTPATLLCGVVVGAAGWSGSGARSVVQATAIGSGGSIAGITLRERKLLGTEGPTPHIEDASLEGPASEIRPGQGFGLLRRGTVWMPAETAFAATDSLFFRHTASALGTDIGSLRNADDGSNTDAVPAGVYEIEQYDATSGLVLVSWMLP